MDILKRDHRLFAAEPAAGHPRRRWRLPRRASFRSASLDIDAFPDTTPVQVQINTVAPSLAPGGSRAADHLPDRAGHQRAAGAGATALDLEVRPVAGGRHLRGRHRHLLRPAVDQRAAGHGRTAAGDRPAQDGAGRHRPGRGVSLRRRPARATDAHPSLRTIHDWVIKPQLRTVPRHGRDQQLGRLREAVPGPHRSRSG